MVLEKVRILPEMITQLQQNVTHFQGQENRTKTGPKRFLILSTMHSAVNQSVSPVSAASAPNPYTNGELVHFQGQAAIYQASSFDCHRPGPGMDTSLTDFQAAGFQWSRVHVLPNGIPRPQDKEWLVFGTRRSGFPVGVIPAPTSIPVTESMPGSGLIHFPGQPAIYLITHEPPRNDPRIRWIPSAVVFNAAGYSWSQVKTVPSVWLVEPGAPMSLLRVTGTTKVYAPPPLNVCLHWIRSGKDFAASRYNGQSVQTVHYLPYFVGSPLTAAPQ